MWIADPPKLPGDGKVISRIVLTPELERFLMEQTPFVVAQMDPGNMHGAGSG